MIIFFANNINPILAEVLILVGTWPSADMTLIKLDALYIVFLEGDYILI